MLHSTMADVQLAMASGMLARSTSRSACISVKPGSSDAVGINSELIIQKSIDAVGREAECRSNRVQVFFFALVFFIVYVHAVEQVPALCEQKQYLCVDRVYLFDFLFTLSVFCNALLQKHM